MRKLTQFNINNSMYRRQAQNRNYYFSVIPRLLANHALHNTAKNKGITNKEPWKLTLTKSFNYIYIYIYILIQNYN